MKIVYIFARQQLGEHALKISKDFKEVERVKAILYSTIKRLHCKFKCVERGNNTDKPNGHPKSPSNEKNVVAVAKFTKSEAFFFIWNSSENSL